jgi:hypothetical protein
VDSKMNTTKSTKIYDFAKNGLYCKNSEWG